MTAIAWTTASLHDRSQRHAARWMHDTTDGQLRSTTKRNEAAAQLLGAWRAPAMSSRWAEDAFFQSALYRAWLLGWLFGAEGWLSADA